MRETEVMASKDHEKEAVCVLDASTYVGFWVVKKLLLKGYTVHAAVQNNGNLSFSLPHRTPTLPPTKKKKNMLGHTRCNIILEH